MSGYELAFALVAILGLVIVYQLFALVGDMAEDRGQSPWLWWLLAVFISPFGSMIILWVFFDLLDDDEEGKDANQ